MLGGTLYHKTGVVGSLALGCSLLGVDLIMRLLMIEKKIAAEFELDRGDSAEPRLDSENSPLLKTPQDSAYVISSELPRWIKAYSILYCFKDARMITANWITLVHALFLGALDATVLIICEKYYGFNSLQTGLLFIPILLSMVLFGPVAGWITDRRGPKTVVVWGFRTTCASFRLTTNSATRRP